MCMSLRSVTNISWQRPAESCLNHVWQQIVAEHAERVPAQALTCINNSYNTKTNMSKLLKTQMHVCNRRR